MHDCKFIWKNALNKRIQDVFVAFNLFLFAALFALFFRDGEILVRCFQAENIVWQHYKPLLSVFL